MTKHICDRCYKEEKNAMDLKQLRIGIKVYDLCKLCSEDFLKWLEKEV